MTPEKPNEPSLQPKASGQSQLAPASWLDALEEIRASAQKLEWIAAKDGGELWEASKELHFKILELLRHTESAHNEKAHLLRPDTTEP